jgi:hypothetical protein
MHSVLHAEAMRGIPVALGDQVSYHFAEQSIAFGDKVFHLCPECFLGAPFMETQRSWSL